MKKGASVFFALLFISLSFISDKAYSQCSATTPSFTIDLTGQPSGSWTSPSVVRGGRCCPAVAPGDQNCVKFVVTLDPAADGLSFGIATGAQPSGSLNYQVDCGP